MFCNKCGSQVPDNMQFCTNCGAPMAAARPAQTPPVYNGGAYQPNSAMPGSTFNFGNTANSMNIFKILVIVFGVVLAIATLLPVISVSFFGVSKSVSFIEADDGEGVVVLLAGLVAAGLALAKLEKFSFIPGIVSAGILLWFTSDAPSGYLDMMSIGFYLMWIGTIGTIATSVVSLVKNK